MIFCLGFRCIVNSRHPFNSYTHIFYTHIRADSLMFGVLLAYWYHFASETLARVSQKRFLLSAISLLLISPAMIYNRESTLFLWTVGYTALYFGFGGVLLVMVNTQPGEGWLGKRLEGRTAQLLAWIGTSSYTIYLWHGLFALRPVESLDRHLLIHIPFIRWGFGMTLYIGLAIGVGVFAGALVDRPMLQMRNRFFPARADALTLPLQSLQRRETASSSDVALSSVALSATETAGAFSENIH